jgi:hypothetical protein
VLFEESRLGGIRHDCGCDDGLTHLRTIDAEVEIRQAVGVTRELPFDLKIVERVELVSWGVMPSGMLRHPVLRAER